MIPSITLEQTHRGISHSNRGGGEIPRPILQPVDDPEYTGIYLVTTYRDHDLTIRASNGNDNGNGNGQSITKPHNGK